MREEAVRLAAVLEDLAAVLAVNGAVRELLELAADILAAAAPTRLELLAAADHITQVQTKRIPLEQEVATVSYISLIIKCNVKKPPLPAVFLHLYDDRQDHWSSIRL